MRKSEGQKIPEKEIANFRFVELLLSTFNAIVSSTSRVISTIYFMFNSIYNNFIICSKFI